MSYCVVKYDTRYCRPVFWTGVLGSHRTPNRTFSLTDAQTYSDPALAYLEAGKVPKLADWRVVRCDRTESVRG